MYRNTISPHKTTDVVPLVDEAVIHTGVSNSDRTISVVGGGPGSPVHRQCCDCSKAVVLTDCSVVDV